MEKDRQGNSRLWFWLRVVTSLGLVVMVMGQGLSAGERIVVTTTTTQVTDLVRRIGGEWVEVNGMMGPGVDPHLYRPSASDIGRLRRANLILYSGLMLEGRMEELLERVGRRGQSVYAVTGGIPREKLLESEEFEGHWDPHVWFDPELWAACAERVGEVLAEVMPGRAVELRQRVKEVQESIAATAEWVKGRLGQVDEEMRVLVTSHDAFNYFGRYFDFEVLAVQGISTDSEAGLSAITAMVDFVRARKVPAVFVETSVSPAAIERVSRDSGAVIGGELYSDSLGPAGRNFVDEDGTSYALDTWEGMMRYNVDTIVRALAVEDGRGR